VQIEEEFNDSSVLAVYQVTVHNKCSKCPTPESMTARTRLNVDCRTISKVPGVGGLQMVYTKSVLYVQVTVHRDILRINNQQDASSIQNFYFVTKLYMFRSSTVPIIRSYQLYTWQLVCFMQVM
jgi:hypothetical protein